MSSPGGSDLCRITVVGPSRRVDIALPGYVSFADLFPAVARYAGLDGPDVVGEKGGWVLQRLGQEPFSPAMTPLQAGLRDGEMIYLRPHRAQLPRLAFDDVADVIATGRERPARPVDAARRPLGGAGRGRRGAGGRGGVHPAVRASVAAARRGGRGDRGRAALAVAAVSRAAGDSRAGAVLGLAAVPYAFLAGLLGPARSAALTHLGAVHLLSAFAAVTLTAVAAAAASAEVPLFFGLTCAGLLGVLGSWIGYAFGIGFDGAAAVIVVPALALTPLIPAVVFTDGADDAAPGAASRR